MAYIKRFVEDDLVARTNRNLELQEAAYWSLHNMSKRQSNYPYFTGRTRYLKSPFIKGMECVKYTFVFHIQTLFYSLDKDCHSL
jgi:hypothetical protein